jgi:hypothetical protein
LWADYGASGSYPWRVLGGTTAEIVGTKLAGAACDRWRERPFHPAIELSTNTPASKRIPLLGVDGRPHGQMGPQRADCDGLWAARASAARGLPRIPIET